MLSSYNLTSPQFEVSLLSCWITSLLHWLDDSLEASGSMSITRTSCLRIRASDTMATRRVGASSIHVRTVVRHLLASYIHL